MKVFRQISDSLKFREGRGRIRSCLPPGCPLLRRDAADDTVTVTASARDRCRIVVMLARITVPPALHDNTRYHQ